MSVSYYRSEHSDGENRTKKNKKKGLNPSIELGSVRCQPTFLGKRLLTREW